MVALVNKSISDPRATSRITASEDHLKIYDEEHYAALKCFKDKLSSMNMLLFENGMIKSIGMIESIGEKEKYQERFDKIDLPFQTCFFEETLSRVVLHNQSTVVNAAARCIFVHEERPREYLYVMLLATGNTEIVSGGMFNAARVERDELSLGGANALTIIRTFSRLVHSSKLGKDSHRPFIKVGTGKHKRTVRPSMVIRVAPKNDYEGVTPLGSHIDWASRWEVRGHWRAISGIGKNRDGEYGVQNWTWVIPHVKGPEDKIVIKKPRIFSGPIEARGPTEERHEVF